MEPTTNDRWISTRDAAPQNVVLQHGKTIGVDPGHDRLVTTYHPYANRNHSLVYPKNVMERVGQARGTAAIAGGLCRLQLRERSYKLQPPDAQFVVKRVDTSENVADLFTKSLPRTTFEKHASSVFLWYY